MCPQWHGLGCVPPEYLTASPWPPHSLSDNRVYFLDEEPEAPMISEGSGSQGLPCTLLMFFPWWLSPGEVTYNSLGGSVFLTDICLSFEAFFPFGGKSPGIQVKLVRRMTAQG